MGAKSSKTKPGDGDDAAALEKDTLVQEIGLGSADLSFKSVKSEREKTDDNAAGHKVSKVQEIMEAKALQISRRGSNSSVVKPLELQVSSSEDSSSDASEHGRDNDRTKKRRKRKKRKQKTKASAAAATAGKAVTPVSSPKATTNLNAVKNVTRLQALPPKQNYFEEIKVAYSLAEYEGKDPPLASTSPKSEPAKAGFFASPLDGWKRHVEIALKGSSGVSGVSRQSTRSTRSARSVGRSEPREKTRPPEPRERPRQLESRDKVRPAAVTPPPRSATPLKTNTSSLGRFMEWDKGTFRSSGRDSESHNSDRSDPMADLDDLERETSSALAEFPRSVNQVEKADETRVAKRPSSSRAPEPKPQRPVTPDLHIDDVDESIMNDILAEVVV